MSKHTPPPWRVYDGDDLVICFGEGDSICDCAPGSPFVRMATAKANAALIVKAVNSHDVLVKALTLAEDVLSRAPFSNALWPNGMHPQGGIQQIRDALAVVGSSGGDK